MEEYVECECGTIVKPKFAGYVFEKCIFIDKENHRGLVKIYYFPDCPKCKRPVFPTTPEAR